MASNNGSIVKVVTDPAKPLQSIKLYRKAAEAYVKAHEGAYIMGEPPVADDSSQDTVTKMVGPMEDKSIDGPSIPRKVKAK